jgi:hypothetical protein
MRFLIRVLNSIRPIPGKKSKVIERNVLFTRVII